MSTSVAKGERRAVLKTAFVYGLAAAFCALLGGVYELFSHQVYVYPMLYAFMLPLCGGALPFLALGLFSKAWLPGRGARCCYHCAITAFTVGCFFKGALLIYGTTSALTKIYWILGALFFLGAVILSRPKAPSGSSANR